MEKTDKILSCVLKFIVGTVHSFYLTSNLFVLMNAFHCFFLFLRQFAKQFKLDKLNREGDDHHLKVGA